MLAIVVLRMPIAAQMYALKILLLRMVPVGVRVTQTLKKDATETFSVPHRMKSFSQLESSFQ
jgi:hypothetical protein